MPDAPMQNSYPGERLGLPQTGPGSIAPLGRRVLALLIDLFCAAIIAYAFFGFTDPQTGVRFPEPWMSNILFFVIQIVFIPTIGGSPGHRLMGMRLMRVDGAWTGVWRPVVRTVLLMLVLPAVIWNADSRGLHDQAAGTVLVRS